MAADVMFNFKIEPPLPLYEIARGNEREARRRKEANSKKREEARSRKEKKYRKSNNT